MLNNKPTKKQVNYAWYLMRSSGEYTEEEMLRITSGATFEGMKIAIDMLVKGDKIHVDLRKATRKQVRYVNDIMMQLGYDRNDHWEYERVDVSIGEADAYIKELEEELEQQQIMEDVLGHGQY